MIARTASGNVTGEFWWRDGKLDRAEGPAIVTRDPVTGQVTGGSWWTEGRRQGARRTAAKSGLLTPFPAP